MPTTRSANGPAPPKRAIEPDSDDGGDEEDDFRAKKTPAKKRGTGARGGGRVRGRGGRGRGGATVAPATKEATSGDDDGADSGEPSSSTPGPSKRGGRGRGRGRGRGAGGGGPPSKRVKKKKHEEEEEEEPSDSEFESDEETDKITDPEMKLCLKMLKAFEKPKHAAYAYVFREPVDVDGLGLDDYFLIIKEPMDMKTMKEKIFREYDRATEFKEDFKLMINNCLTFNNNGDPVCELAMKFRRVFAAKWKKNFPDYPDKFVTARRRVPSSSDDSEPNDIDPKDIPSVYNSYKRHSDLSDLSDEDDEEDAADEPRSGPRPGSAKYAKQEAEAQVLLQAAAAKEAAEKEAAEKKKKEEEEKQEQDDEDEEDSSDEEDGLDDDVIRIKTLSSSVAEPTEPSKPEDVSTSSEAQAVGEIQEVTNPPVSLTQPATQPADSTTGESHA